ncbi:hypothetical protein BY996DRAFT_8556102, partial [Phakopsora pachyrhizi]
MGLTTPNQVDKLNPRTNEFDFGGILGALGITITVPIFTYLLNPSCQPIVGGKLNSFETISEIQEVWNETRLFSHEGFNLCFCWYIYMVICARFGQWPFLYVIDHYFEIIAASLIMSI